ncbi:hypothetical protein MJT46_005804 [Ovis ammon polii x Ovis aries]|nr:hypothetical protein MJT46_005804 [Ovis ammon polii x Ovis aries]
MLRQIIGQAKRHPSLIPLFIFIGAGGTGAALYVMRLALFNPDVRVKNIDDHLFPLKQSVGHELPGRDSYCVFHDGS